MRTKFREWPTPHLLLNDIFSLGEQEEMMSELTEIEDRLEFPGRTGSAGISGFERKRNMGTFLEDGETPARMVLARVSDRQVAKAWEPNWLSEIYDTVSSKRVLYSLYGNGDRYLSHRDSSLFTALIWLHSYPKPFEGGDLTLSDHGYTLPPASNTGIIFLSHEYHEVSEVQGEGRQCLTVFLGKG